MMLKQIKKSKGMSIVELMVGIVLLSSSMIAAMGVLNMVSEGQKKNEDDLDFTATRNQIVSMILDDTSWQKMVNSSLNPEMTCLKDQNQGILVSRDCLGKADALALLNIKGDLVHDFHNVIGFTRAGRPCPSPFNGTAGMGNPACPYRVDVSWMALCPPGATSCVNPPLRFVATHFFNSSAQQVEPNLKALNFNLIKTGIYCPAGGIPASYTPGPDVSVTADKVTSTLNTKTLTTDVATTNIAMYPCKRISMSFFDDMPTAGDLGPGYVVTDAENSASVTIVENLTNAVRYEFVRTNVGGVYSYELRHNGVTRFTKPTWLTIDKTSVFKFQITNGLVRFCVNDRCLHYFEEKLDFPFRFSFRPAARPYSANGINTIQNNITEY